MFEGFADGIGRPGYWPHSAPNLMRKSVPSLDEALKSLQAGLGGFGGNFTATPARFIFRPRTGRLNWRLLHSLDLDRVVHDGDVESIQAHMDNIMFARFDREDFELCTDECIIKVVKLAQLQMEFLYSVATTSQTMLQGLVEKAKLQSAQLKGSKYRMREQQHSSVPRMSRRRSPSREHDRAQYCEKGVARKCPYCTKRFQSEQYLHEHIMRRHPGDYFAGSSPPHEAFRQVVIQPQMPQVVTQPNPPTQSILPSPSASAPPGVEPVDQERLAEILKDATSGIQGQMQVVTRDLADALRAMKQDVERVADNVKGVADDVVKLQQQSGPNTPRKAVEAARTPPALQSPSVQQVVDFSAFEKRHVEFEQRLERTERTLLNKLEEAVMAASTGTQVAPQQNLEPKLEEFLQRQKDVQLQLQQSSKQVQEMARHAVNEVATAAAEAKKAAEIAKQAAVQAPQPGNSTATPAQGWASGKKGMEQIAQESVPVPSSKAQKETQQPSQQQTTTPVTNMEPKQDISSAWQIGAGVGEMESDGVTLDQVDEIQNDPRNDVEDILARNDTAASELMSTIQKTKEPRKSKKDIPDDNLEADGGQNDDVKKDEQEKDVKTPQEIIEQSKEALQTPQQRQRNLVQKVFKKSLQDFFWHCRPDLRPKPQQPQENLSRQDVKRLQEIASLNQRGGVPSEPASRDQMLQWESAGQGNTSQLRRDGPTSTPQIGGAMSSQAPQQNTKAHQPVVAIPFGAENRASIQDENLPPTSAQFAGSPEVEPFRAPPEATFIAQTMPSQSLNDFGGSNSRNLVTGPIDDIQRNAQLSNEPGIARSLQGPGWMTEQAEEERRDARFNERFWDDVADTNQGINQSGANMAGREGDIATDFVNSATDINEKPSAIHNASEVSAIPELSAVNDTSNLQWRQQRDVADTPIGNGRLNFDSRGIAGSPIVSQSVVQEVDVVEAVESFDMRESSFDSSSPARAMFSAPAGGGNQPTMFSPPSSGTQPALFSAPGGGNQPTMFGPPSGGTQPAMFSAPPGGILQKPVGIAGTASGTMSGWGDPVQSAPPRQFQAPSSSSAVENVVETFEMQDVSSDDQSPPMSRNPGRMGGGGFNNQLGAGRLNQLSSDMSIESIQA